MPSIAQSIGLVNTGPDQVSEPKEVEYLTQRTSTDALGGYNHLHKRRGYVRSVGLFIAAYSYA